MEIGSQCPENLSDHIEVVIHTGIDLTYTLENDSMNRHPCPSSNSDTKPKIRWDKCANWSPETRQSYTNDITRYRPYGNDFE